MSPISPHGEFASNSESGPCDLPQAFHREKVICDRAYELNNRPDWLMIQQLGSESILDARQ